MTTYVTVGEYTSDRLRGHVVNPLKRLQFGCVMVTIINMWFRL